MLKFFLKVFVAKTIGNRRADCTKVSHRAQAFFAAATVTVVLFALPAHSQIGYTGRPIDNLGHFFGSVMGGAIVYNAKRR